MESGGIAKLRDEDLAALFLQIGDYPSATIP
jgi:hypothetical protein